MKLLVVAAVIGLLFVFSNRANRIAEGDGKPPGPGG